jgi:hypothetical protein
MLARRAAQVSAKWFKQFAAHFISTLPREMRDMVYDLLISNTLGGNPGETAHTASTDEGNVEGTETETETSQSDEDSEGQELAQEDGSPYIVPCSVPQEVTDRTPWHNVDLPWCLRLGVNTLVTRELAEYFCKLTSFRIYGVEQLGVFLRTSFLLAGCIPQQHIRRLEIVMRPAFWDLPRLPDAIVAGYSDYSWSTNRMLKTLLRVQNLQGFQLKIAVYVREQFGDSPIKGQNVIFDCWIKSALPVLGQLVENGMDVKILQIEARGFTLQGYMLRSGAIFEDHEVYCITSATLFNHPKELWETRIRERTAFEVLNLLQASLRNQG